MMSIPYSGTAIGVVSKDGVLLATDKSYVYGNLVMSGNVKKVFAINDRVGLAAAGIAADMQQLLSDLTYLVKIREIRLGRRMKTASIAKLTSFLMYRRRMIPYLTQVLIGGYIDNPELYSLDSLGSVIGDKYIVLGTGAEVAVGVIEANYREDISISETIELVRKSFQSVAQRDVLTGSTIDMMIIKNDGIIEKTVKLVG